MENLEAPFYGEFEQLIDRIKSTPSPRSSSAPDQVKFLEGNRWAMVCLFEKAEFLLHVPRERKELMERCRKVIDRSENLIDTFMTRNPHKGIRIYKKAIYWIEDRSLTRKIEEINKEMISILQELRKLPTSGDSLGDYLNIPSYLWPCICYFLQFPANFEIPSRRLTVLWVAEGFVHPAEDGVSLANHAKRYLDDLIAAKVITAKMKLGGKVKSCQLNAVTRDHLSKIAEASLKCYRSELISPLDHPHHHRGSTVGKASRLIHFKGNHISKLDSTSNYRNVFSFFSFDSREGNKPGEDIGDLLRGCISAGCFRRMKVLDLEQVFRPKLPKALSELALLRYLGLRWTYLEHLPDFVNELFNLRVLDVKHTYISVLPKSIWQMQSLRHLYLSEIYRTRFDIRPSDHIGLTGLRTLWGAIIDEKTQVKEGLDTLKEIKKLGLSCRATSSEVGVLEDNLDAVAQWISKLTHLEALKLQSRDVKGNPYRLPLKPLETYDELSTVYLVGKLEQTIVSAFPKNLIDITLSGSELQMDPMGSLGSLEKLEILRLLAKSIACKTMRCSSGGFPELRVLYIWMLDDLEEWEVDGGSLPSLQELEIRSCPNLKMLPNQLQTVNSLQIIKLTKMLAEFIAKTRHHQPELWYKVDKEKLKRDEPDVAVSEYRRDKTQETRDDSSLIQLIRVEVTSIIRHDVPIIIQRELKKFFSHRDARRTFAKEQPSSALAPFAAPATSPIGVTVPIINIDSMPTTVGSRMAATFPLPPPPAISPPATRVNVGDDKNPILGQPSNPMITSEKCIGQLTLVAKDIVVPTAQPGHNGIDVDVDSVMLGSNADTDTLLKTHNTRASTPLSTIIYPWTEITTPAPLSHSITTANVSPSCFQIVRQRDRSMYLHSPFKPDDKRREHVTEEEYKKFLETMEWRNIGYDKCTVAPQFFKDIENPSEDFDREQIDAYLSILHINPLFANVWVHEECRGKYAIVDTFFGAKVWEIWRRHHENDPSGMRYDHQTKENLHFEEVASLVQYVHGERPHWRGVLPWSRVDKVIMVCHTGNHHWIVCCLDLKMCHINVFDSLRHNLTDDTLPERARQLRPLRRIIPAILDHAGFWDEYPDLQPLCAQLPVNILLPEMNFRQEDNHSCGPFALAMVEGLIANRAVLTGAQDRIRGPYRRHVALTIYRFSTDADTWEPFQWPD